MRTGWVKIVGMAALIVLLVSGVSFAGGYRCGNGGYYGPRHGYHHPHRPYHGAGYIHGYRPHPPVVVERYYYPAPPRVYHPGPGSYFGMSVTQPGVAFGFGFHN